MKAWAHDLADASSIGWATRYLVVLSMAVSTYLKPLDMGSGPTTSVCTTVKRFLGTSKSCTPGSMRRCVFDYWHSWHSCAHFVSCLDISGQTYRFAMCLTVALGPMCVRLCMRLKTPFLHSAGTRGLAVPVDVSQ